MTDVKVTDPGYKGRIVVLHDDLADDDARDVVEVYVALGYPEKCIWLDDAPAFGEAA